MLSFLPYLLNTWQLPGLAAGAISSVLGKRILLFLLKRTLGHLIKDNDIKLDQIDAPSFGGKLEVRDVHLDAKAITKLLPDVPLRLDSGLVGSITIQLPWPNLWKGDLTITISNLNLHMKLDESARGSRKANLHESLASVAEEALHQDSDGKELEESIQSSILEENDTNSPKPISTNGYIAGVVDSLLTRLKISINNLKVSLATGHDIDSEMQIRVKTIQAGTELQQSDSLINVIRTASLHKVELYLCRKGLTDQSVSEDNSEDADDSGSESNYMEMSQAIPDLRTSQAASDMFHSTISGSANSMYASAIGGPAVDRELSNQVMTKVNSESSSEHLLLSTGSDPVVANFAITRPLAKSELISQEEDLDSVASAIEEVKMTTSLEVANLIGFLTPTLLSGLIRFIDVSMAVNASSHSHQSTPISKNNVTFDTNQNLVELSTALHCANFDLVCAYEDLDALETTEHSQCFDSVQAYWTRPNKTHPQIGHLRLRLQELHYEQQNSKSIDKRSTQIQVGDLALYEHLSPNLVQGTASMANILPILLFDFNLNDGLGKKRSSKKESQSSQRERNLTKERFLDCIDWRYAASSNESLQGNNTRSSPYWRTSYGDRGWKVRPKHHHQRSSSLPPVGQESSSIFKASINEGEGARVSLAPVHVFIDLSLANRIMPLLLQLVNIAGQGIKESAESESTASLETLHQASVNVARHHTESNILKRLDLECSLLRLEVRIPNSIPENQSEGGQQGKKRRLLGLQVRAGILIIDAQRFNLRLGQGQELSEPSHKMSVHFQDLQRHSMRQKEIANCTIDQISTFYKPVNDQRAISFACIGMIVSDQEQIEKSLRPRLQVLQRDSQIPADPSMSTRSFIDCNLPLVEVCISKQLLDGLELIADDFGLWLKSLSEAGNDKYSSENANEALKILGSRFFGSARQSFTALSGSSTSVELLQDINSIPAFSLRIDDGLITLVVANHQSLTFPKSRYSLVDHLRVSRVKKRLPLPDEMLLRPSLPTSCVRRCYC